MKFLKMSHYFFSQDRTSKMAHTVQLLKNYKHLDNSSDELHFFFPDRIHENLEGK